MPNTIEEALPALHINALKSTARLVRLEMTGYSPAKLRSMDVHVSDYALYGRNLAACQMRREAISAAYRTWIALPEWIKENRRSKALRLLGAMLSETVELQRLRALSPLQQAAE